MRQILPYICILIVFHKVTNTILEFILKLPFNYNSLHCVQSPGCIHRFIRIRRQQSYFPTCSKTVGKAIGWSIRLGIENLGWSQLSSTPRLYSDIERECQPYSESDRNFLLSKMISAVLCASKYQLHQSGAHVCGFEG